MTDSQQPSLAPEERVLLPSHVVPVRYDLSLTPDLESFTFSGIVGIECSVDQSKLTECSANKIVLHAKELTFESAEYCVVEVGGQASAAAPAVEAEEIRVNFKETTVEVLFGAPIPNSASKIRVTIRFAGTLNDQMGGFYRSTYHDSVRGGGRKEEAKVMACTQFEPLDARRAFPCVDEPSAKAVFGLTLTVPAHLQGISNMPESSVLTLPDGRKELTFLDTPRMSTYLLAFCVGDFDFVQARTGHGVMVRVYTTPGRASSGRFALEAAVRALDLYDDFFSVPYPLPKLDMVAVPDFLMGAMENWGLVTYREVDLLIDPVTASSQQKQRVATVVHHELAHQWFGNLVTMTWWSSLWLNESFASWCENWATDRLFPDYAMWEQFTTSRYLAALRLDAMRSSHPIQVPIRRAEEVEQVFDAISYSKGASVIRMIHAVLGMEHFQSGLVAYMKKHAYGNTETGDLWAAWEEASGIPVGELMASWTEQMGFPLLRVTGEDWQDDTVTLVVEQSWFLSDGSDLDDEGAAKKWTIPILTCTGAGTQDDTTLMRERTATVTIPIAKGDWVKLNADEIVPMRVLPSEEMLNRMAPDIRSKAMQPIDRSGLLNDAYALVKAGHMAPETLLRLLGNYSAEDHYVVWEGISNVLVGIDTVLQGEEEMSANFRTLAKKMTLKLLDLVGWESSSSSGNDSASSDGHLTTLHRAMMVNLLSKFAYDETAVVQEANRRFAAFLADPNDVASLPGDLRASVFKIVLHNGGPEAYEQVKSYFYNAANNAERKHVLNSIGSTPDSRLKLATMEWATSGQVKLQDFFYAMGSVGRSNAAGREIAWQYYKDNFDKIRAMLATANAHLMSACIVTCTAGFCSHSMADDIEAFFREHPLPKASRKIAQTLENTRANAKFFETLKASETLSNQEFWTALL